VWWVDPGWTPGAHQAAPSLPSSAGRGREKYDEELVGQVKDGEITQQLLAWAKQTQLGEISSIYC